MSPIRILLGAAAFSVLGLSACSSEEDADGNRKSLAGEGREETQGIRNTENIGYSGNAIGAKVDAALDANDQRTGDLDRQLEGME